MTAAVFIPETASQRRARTARCEPGWCSSSRRCGQPLPRRLRSAAATGERHWLDPGDPPHPRTGGDARRAQDDVLSVGVSGRDGSRVVTASTDGDARIGTREPGNAVRAEGALRHGLRCLVQPGGGGSDGGPTTAGLWDARTASDLLPPGDGARFARSRVSLPHADRHHGDDGVRTYGARRAAASRHGRASRATTLATRRMLSASERLGTSAALGRLGRSLLQLVRLARQRGEARPGGIVGGRSRERPRHQPPVRGANRLERDDPGGGPHPDAARAGQELADRLPGRRPRPASRRLRAPCPAKGSRRKLVTLVVHDRPRGLKVAAASTARASASSCSGLPPEEARERRDSVHSRAEDPDERGIGLVGRRLSRGRHGGALPPAPPNSTVPRRRTHVPSLGCSGGGLKTSAAYLPTATSRRRSRSWQQLDPGPGAATRPCSARPDRHRRRRCLDHRGDPAARARDRPQQDAAGAALAKVPRGLPGERGRVLRPPTTTTTSPIVRPQADLYIEKDTRETTTSTGSGTRPPRTCSPGATR